MSSWRKFCLAPFLNAHLSGSDPLHLILNSEQRDSLSQVAVEQEVLKEMETALKVVVAEKV